MIIQKIILDIRKQNGMSQEEFAEKLSVTRQAVSRWENGETTPTIDSLKTISKLFNIDANNLLGLSEATICQSCAMPLNAINDFGINNDETINLEYCHHCFASGSFTNNRTLEEMVEANLRFLEEFNTQNETNYTADDARKILKLHLSSLKRWKKN